MKKNLFRLLVIGAGTALMVTGCKKDDTAPPVITLSGASSIEISLNSPDWTDLGATATDDEDGAITTITSDASSTNPNTDLVGTYTITYTATDAAGNVGTAVRTIRVKNDAEDWAGSYNVHDTIPGDFFNYTQTITVDETTNNRVHFSEFAYYANNTGIYATKLGNGNLEIPSQTAVDIGTNNGGLCDIATHAFSSVSFTSTSAGFVLGYNDQITAPANCIGAIVGTATYIRQ